MSSSQRLSYIDNLRVFLTILVLVLHAAVTYGSEGGWYYQEETQDMAVIILLTILSAVFQSFFMGLFFFLSGYFTPRSYDRKGFGNFILDRLLRLGIPCLLFFYGIGPLSTYLAEKIFYGQTYSYRLLPHIGTMWFAQALLLFGLIYALVRLVVRTPIKEKDNQPLPPAWQFILGTVLMAALTFLVRYFYPWGTGLWGMIFGDFPQYILMFVAGILAYRNNWLDAVKQAVSIKRLWIVMVILILLLPVMMVLGEDPVAGLDYFMGGLYWQAVAYAAWNSAMCVVVSLLLLHVFAVRFNQQNKLQIGMAGAAYTVYIIHPVFLILGSVLLAGLPAHPLIKFVLLAILGVLVTFPVANSLKKLPGLRSIL